MAVIYIMDTSEWINLFKRYPETVFPELWAKIENLISDTKIVSPEAVLDEIKRGDDEMVSWCKDHRKIFCDIDDLAGLAKKIIKKHPTLVKPDDKHVDADPFIIALAEFYKRGSIAKDTPIIVTDENVLRSSGIPYVARDYSIRTCKLLEMFKMEGWKF